MSYEAEGAGGTVAPLGLPIQGSQLPNTLWRNGPWYLRMPDPGQAQSGLRGQGRETAYTCWHCPQCPERDAAPGPLNWRLVN